MIGIIDKNKKIVHVTAGVTDQGLPIMTGSVISGPQLAVVGRQGQNFAEVLADHELRTAYFKDKH